MAKNYIKLWDSYDSYFEPLGAAEVGRLVLAMMKYKSSGAEPEFSGSEKFIWPAIRRDLDEDAAYTEKKATAGKAGGAPEANRNAGKNKQKQAKTSTPEQKQTGLRTKDVGLRTEDKKEISPDGDIQKSADALPDSAPDADLARIIQHFEQACGQFPRSALDRLQHWRQEYPTDVILLAIDKAAEAGKRSWNYIEGILRGWKQDGVKCVGDVQANDARRQKQKANAPRSKAFMASRPPEEAAQAPDFLKNAMQRRPLRKKGSVNDG